MISDVAPTPASDLPKPLRLWPAVVLIALQLLLRHAVPAVVPDGQMIGFFGSLICALLVLVWWLFFSRAPWLERIGVVLVMALALFLTKRFVHPSIAGGAMGYLLYVFGLPALSLALVVAVVVARRWIPARRRVAIGVGTVLACAAFTLMRTGGMDSEGRADLNWRWAQTHEERLLAKGTPAAAKKDVAVPAAPAVVSPQWTGEWLGFRGAQRDSVVRSPQRIDTDWSTSPPKELWRRPVGPGWSSFAVQAGLVYTQEQLGENEIVSCYRLGSGEVVWQHKDATRFYESNAGPGPRGTPTLHDGQVYTFGATGMVNALDATTGKVIWKRDAAADTKKKAPEWGFASSPLVVDNLVVVAVTGTLIAYDRATGAIRWTGPADGKSYSSPHLLEIDGVRQIVLMSGKGATSVSPADGKVLWQHAWDGFAIVQPAMIDRDELLISTGDRTGARRITVKRAKDTWTVEEKWTTNRLKPYFNDCVLHKGHAYGFDNGILACIDLESGTAKWKGGRYGRGQVLLLPEQDVLLVLGEQGELALVAAKPDAFTELARHPALKGKTWNHPVLAGDVLLVRNDVEMAAFRVKLKG